jgi:hypothetical protein
MVKSIPVLVLLGLCGLCMTGWADPPARVGRLSYVQGSVFYCPSPGGKWEAATANYPLTAGNLLSTGGSSRAELHIGSSAISVAPQSEISIDALDDLTAQVRVDKGTVSISVRHLDPNGQFQIEIQTAAITLSAPGRYRVDVKESGETDLTVREGNAHVTGGQSGYQVPAGSEAQIPATGPDLGQIQPAAPLDSWDQWVASRDRRDDKVASAKYVSREMDGVEDLDDFGTWRVIAGYGPVWVPTGLPVGWRPYTVGSWEWVEPWGWTWVDREPWGFAPFHYGRWAFSAGVWFWVPGPLAARPVFVPALVAWVGAAPGRAHPPDGVAIRWAPLRPWQAYHPWYGASVTYVHTVNRGVIVRPRYKVRSVVVRERPEGYPVR